MYLYALNGWSEARQEGNNTLEASGTDTDGRWRLEVHHLLDQLQLSNCVWCVKQKKTVEVGRGFFFFLWNYGCRRTSVFSLIIFCFVGYFCTLVQDKYAAKENSSRNYRCWWHGCTAVERCDLIWVRFNKRTSDVFDDEMLNGVLLLSVVKEFVWTILLRYLLWSFLTNIKVITFE